MINAALVLALMLHYLWIVGVEDMVATGHEILLDHTRIFLVSSLPLTLVALVAFYTSGFYTRGRAYQGRYKALIVTQGVGIAYLIFGLAVLIVRAVSFPRSVLFLSWGLTLVMLVGARLWSRLWADMIRMHEPTSPPGARKVQRVLVIGGAGYIGSALLPKLLDNGYRVRLLDLFVYGKEPIQDLLDHPRLEILQADFRQVDRVAEAMRGMDAVIHLGAIVGDPACALDGELTVDVNLMATCMIAEIAKGYGVNRFIFASTCSVYGASDEILDERSALNPLSLYARSKIASETILRSLADDRFAPVILRFGTIYGLSGRTRFDLVANLLMAKAIVDGKITVMGGDQWRPFVHVDDAALAVFRVLEAPLELIDRQTFNVGSDEQNYILNDVGRIIQRLVPTAELVEMGLDGDRRNYRVSFAKIRKTLSFKPRWTLEQGLQQVKDALTSGRIQDYRLAQYNNFKFLSEEGTERLGRRHRDRILALLNNHDPETAVVGVA
jgi:nucleoside-diphosphate-sugar epimerase